MQKESFLPSVVVITEDSASFARLAERLAEIPVQRKTVTEWAEEAALRDADRPGDSIFPPPDPPILLFLSDEEAYLQVLSSRPDLPFRLASTVLFSPSALSAEVRCRKADAGYAFVADAGTPDEVLQRRLEVLLAQKGREACSRLALDKVRTRNASLQGLLDYQHEFLQMAVHDLRSPLSAMICYAELLMEGVLGNLEASQLEPIHTIHRNCQFLIDMVNDLLDSAKIGAGKLQLQMSRTDFNREVELAVESLRSLASTKNIAVETRFEPLPEAFLDAQKISRVLSNLLGNAIKFTKAQGKIVLQTRRQDNTLVFSIQDTGPGISPADLEAIFEKFNTAPASNVTGKGHGLGLAISKSFVELHGGSLFVESMRHKGSVFIVHLPLEKRRAEAARPQERKVVVLDFARDLPALPALPAVEMPGAARIEYRPGETQPKPLADIGPRDVLLVNEGIWDSSLSREAFLLALSDAVGEGRCALLVPGGLSESDKEMRRLLGFRLWEKPCTVDELTGRLQALIGLDRRRRTG